MNTYTSSDTHPRLARWSLIVGIVIVLNMFFNYAISLVYKEPTFEAYMTQPQVIVKIQTKEGCLSIGGQWNENIAPIPDTQKQEVQGYCDPDYTKRISYEKDHVVYQRNVFIILVILGIASLISGVVVGQIILTPAFAWGGVLSLVIASMRYWSAADTLIKVLILGAALGGLIWIAIKKFSK